ncbi:MAG: primosomal protein N'' [Phenylobacterium sp.]|jgi:primosomal protein N''
MKNILPHLDNSIKDIYHKAIDADKQILELKKQGMAKFNSIFPEQSLFNATGNRFIPYVSELSADIETFKQLSADKSADENESKESLALILQKMEQLLKVIGALKNITKSN